jgi:hypothetical protein
MQFRLLLAFALAAVCVPQLRADVSARVCNTGQLSVDAAVAYEEHGVISSEWAISGSSAGVSHASGPEALR